MANDVHSTRDDARPSSPASSTSRRRADPDGRLGELMIQAQALQPRIDAAAAALTQAETARDQAAEERAQKAYEALLDEQAAILEAAEHITATTPGELAAKAAILALFNGGLNFHAADPVKRVRDKILYDAMAIGAALSPDRDAELLDLCARYQAAARDHQAAEERHEELHAKARENSTPEAQEASKAADEVAQTLFGAAAYLRDQMVSLRPHTLAGAIAKARSASISYGGAEFLDRAVKRLLDDGSDADALCLAAVRDLASLPLNAGVGSPIAPASFTAAATGDAHG